MDDRQRETHSGPEADDDAEYELEEPDPTVISAEERRKKEILEDARLSIDIDEIYRESEHQRGAEILEKWARSFRFRFGVKHLFVATAIVAIVLALAQFGLLWHALIISVMLTIASIYMFLSFEERKHQAEVDRKREELYKRRREQLAAKHGGQRAASALQPLQDAPVAAPVPLTEADEDWEEATKREPIRIQYSMRQLIMVMTVAALIFGTIKIFGSPAITATVLGFVALLGLVVHALGFELPQMVVFGWWFILVLYVVLSIFSALWTH